MSATLICVPIMGETIQKMIADIQKAKLNGADLFEIRLDSLKTFNPSEDLNTFMQQHHSLPFLFTYRPKWEGGMYEGDENQRLDALRLAMELEADYIDVELKVAHQFYDSIRGKTYNKTKVIVSSHNYQQTPSVEDLGNLVARIQATGADIVKIATTAVEITDVARMFQIMVHSQVPFIGLVMGDRGLISRILCAKFGGYLTFGTLESGVVSAPGQPTLKDLLHLYNFRQIGPDTKVYGIVGKPVSHSKSPILFNEAFKTIGFDGVFVFLLVDDLANFLRTYSSTDFVGFSVTIPHKEAALKCCDEVDPVAKSIGAVNCVVRRPTDGKLIGYNTDYVGAISAIEDGLRGKHIDSGTAVSPLAGKLFVVLGAGGAGKALAYGAKEKGARIVIANRTYDRARELADVIGGDALTLNDLDNYHPEDGMILANTTSIGMQPKVDETPISKHALKFYSLVFVRMVLQREVEKKKNPNKKNVKNVDEELELVKVNYSEGELRKELPNGVMEIAPVSTSHRRDDDDVVDFHCNGKAVVTPPYFRSKNVDRRVLSDNFQVLKKCRRKKCHWCQSSDSLNLIKCNNCQKEFFCMDCIKQRYFDTQNEVKKACPVCRGTCSCKDCRASQCKDRESKDCLAGTSRVDRILHFHYLVCMLLPVIKQISEDQHAELETEAKNKGESISDIIIKQIEFDCNEIIDCNYCKTPILNLHRSCLNCSYSLCLRCCQTLSQGSPFEHINSPLTELPDKMDTCIADESCLFEDKSISSDDETDTSMLLDSTGFNGTTDSISCPPSELGGCGNDNLDLRCVFPISWIEDMEAKAEEIVCSYDVPEILDKNSSCSLCIDRDHKTNRHKQFEEAARREDSNDNCLFYPTVFDINCDHFEHFQKHWGKGHPVVVRDVLRSTKKLSWDPLVLFCAYLESSIARYENNKDLLEACLDWWEVEINIRQHFTGSLKYQPRKNDWHETLKLNGWLSSQLFKEQFPAHSAEVIGALPLQEYMNPRFGLLNLAANIPEGRPIHDKGPYVHISYGCADDKAYSVLNLSYDSYDVVNIMVYTTDVPVSTEHLTKITKLLKKHRTLCQRGSPKITTENAEDAEQKEPESIVNEGTDFYRRVNRTSYISTEVKAIASQSLENNTSSNGECGSGSDAEKTERSLPFHKTDQSTEMYSVAQWDVFRRQDVPKLLEYVKRHRDEFCDTNEYDSNKIVHPILDQRIFLDNTHKMRLKEEFEIEPWTFEQNVGEAIIIPAGCPYQIRNSKYCVQVVLEFMSSESVAECIQLTDEIHLLPENHKAKVDKIEVKKMALHSMDMAIKEIRELTSNPKHD